MGAAFLILRLIFICPSKPYLLSSSYLFRNKERKNCRRRRSRAMATGLPMPSTSSLGLSLSSRPPPLLSSYCGKRTMLASYQGDTGSPVSATTRGYNRRHMIAFLFGFSSLVLDSFQAHGAGLPPEEKPRLCDDSCEQQLENVPMVTTESGLQYKDIKVGQGPSPPVGYQVAANYVAMVPSGQIFDSSLEKGQLYIFRVGSGQVIKGLDEGILTMKIGGKRRLYIPGSLAFPKGLTSAPGRPRVAPSSPVVFDVSLEYVPGLEIEEECLAEGAQEFLQKPLKVKDLEKLLSYVKPTVPVSNIRTK